MIRAIAMVLFSLSLISCGTTGSSPGLGTQNAAPSASESTATDDVLPVATPDESWVWSERGCCQMTTEDGSSCFEDRTENWCESSRPSFADADWREGTSCQFVASCAN